MTVSVQTLLASNLPLGYTGSQGALGYTGSFGTTGFTGSVGFTGSRGDFGFTGSQGDIGYSGSVGFTGSKGITQIGNTAPVAPVNGDTWWNSDTGVRYVYYDDGNSSQWVQESAPPPPALADPIVINDISTQFDGYKSVFNLMTDQTPVTTIIDSKDIDVTINGLLLAPYIDTVTFPWLSPFDQQGAYRVANNQIIIYNSPAVGDRATIILRQVSKTRQKNKYPYSANTILLGD
jgi:hypothetical protein